MLNYLDIKPEKQIGDPSYYRKRTPMDNEIDIKKPIQEQINIFRVSDNENYPAFFYYKNIKYILKIYKEKN